MGDLNCLIRDPRDWAMGSPINPSMAHGMPHGMAHGIPHQLMGLPINSLGWLMGWLMGLPINSLGRCISTWDDALGWLMG